MNVSYGQVIADYKDISIFFGDKQRSSTNLESLIKTMDNQLLAVQNASPMSSLFTKGNSRYTFNYINDYWLPETEEITFYGEGKKTNIIDYSVLNNQLIAISYSSSFFNKSPKLFYHFINPKSKAKSNHGFSLADEYFFDEEIDIERLKLFGNKEQTAVSLLYFPKSQTDSYTRIKYINFKNQKSQPNSGNFVYPSSSSSYKIIDYYVISDSLAYFITGKQNLNNLNQEIEDHYYSNVSISQIKNGELKSSQINGEGRFLKEVYLQQDSNRLKVIGLYANFFDGTVTGFYTGEIDAEGNIEQNKFTPFEEDISNAISEINAEFRSDVYTIKYKNRGFKLMEYKRTENGYVGIAEFNALEYRYGGSEVPGSTNTVDSYFWSGEVLIFMINEKGEMMWSRLVPKYQRSINDGGYYISTASYFTSSELHLFFNDSKLNYDTNGKYNKNGDSPLPASFSPNKNTIAHISLDLQNGEIERKSTIGREQTDVLLIPRLSVAFQNTNKLMIYGRSGNRHRTGSISFR